LDNNKKKGLQKGGMLHKGGMFQWATLLGWLKF
jgi:hypothetical protein